MAAALQQLVLILQLDEAINRDEIVIVRWDWYPTSPGLDRLVSRFDSGLQLTAASIVHIDLSNGKPFYYNQDDEILIACVITFMLKLSNIMTEIPKDVIRLIFQFLKTKYKSHLSSTMKPPLLTLSDNNTKITASMNEYGICRCEYPLPKNKISIWYVSLSWYLTCMDGGNNFGVISNYDQCMISSNGEPLFRNWDDDPDDAYPEPATYYGINGIGYYEDSDKTNWIQTDYSNEGMDLKFKVVCDLRYDENHLTIYDMQTTKKIGYKHLDYTIRLPVNTENKKYVWYPCCCPWGPIYMRITFD